MNLYEINAQIDELTEQMIDPETGEVNEAVEHQIEELDMEKEQKIEYLALKVKNLLAEADALKNEKDKLDKRAKVAANKADSIKKYIGNILKGEKFSTPKTNISWRKSESVEVINSEIIPEQFMLCRTEMRPQKLLIKEAIKNGEDVPGATLKVNNNMSID